MDKDGGPATACGKARLMSFGSAVLSAGRGRDKRDTARKQVANGIDPVEERKA